MNHNPSSSAPVGRSTKRELSAELHDSPTAKRAKRVRPNKKDRPDQGDKDEKAVKVEKDADRYVEQMDWVDLAADLPPPSPAGRKRSASRPPSTPSVKPEQPTSEKGEFSKLLNSFPLKQVASEQGMSVEVPAAPPAVQTPKSAEKTNDENQLKDSAADGGRSAEKERKRIRKALKKAMKKAEADGKIGPENDGSKDELMTDPKPGLGDDDIMKGATQIFVNPTNQPSPKVYANTRKTWAERTVLKPLPMFSTAGLMPAVAGPSTQQMTPARQHKELTPMSEEAPRRDLTFKAYPNPPAVEFSPLAKVNTAKEAEKVNKGKEVEKVEDINGGEKVQEAEAAKTTTADKLEGKAKTKGSKKAKTPKESKTKSPKAPKQTPIHDNSSPMANGTPPTAPASIEASIPSPLPPSLQTAPAGTKTLKAINKHLKAISATLAGTTTTTATNPLSTAAHNNTNNNEAMHTELSHLRTDIARLHDRLARDTLRAAARHEMLFNALIKVSSDVLTLASAVHDNNNNNTTTPTIPAPHEDGTDAAVMATTNGGGTPRAGGKEKEVRERLSRSMLQSRKTLEQCLRIYSGDMDRAGSVEEVARYAGLVVQYAGDLFKTLG